MTGISSDSPVQIVTPILEDAVQGSDYFQEIFPAFGRAPRLFSIKSGQLPNGISLSKSGVLTGNPSQTGKAEFEAQVVDANGQSASRKFALNVVADSTPEIKMTQFPKLRQGAYVRIPLQSESNNGPVFWKITGGQLPIGLVLNDGGFLEGTPGQSGAFEVTLSATDSDTQNPETVTRTFAFEVASPEASTVFARKVTWKPEADGKWGENEKWQFEQPISKVLSGTPNDATPQVDMVYNEDGFYVAVLVKDDSVIGADTPGWAWKDNGTTDLVRIYLDGKNNREAVYNWDDFRFSQSPGAGSANIRGGWWAWSKAGRVEGGYLVESRLWWDASGQMLTKTRGDWLSVGVDVHVFDVDTKDGSVLSRVAWFGTEKNDTDPSGYRTVIMRP